MKLLTNEYFAKHPIKDYSAARILYTFLVNPEYYDALNNRRDPLTGMKFGDLSEIAAQKQAIDAEEDTARLFRMLKRSLNPSVSRYLREKLLRREDEILPMIFSAIPKAFNDQFVENITKLLCECNADPSDRILELYSEIKYPYTRSTLCLVLGFRAEPSVIPFLMEQVDYFERHISENESFDQAPLIALAELSRRFTEA